LDPAQIIEIRDLIKELAKKSTVLLSTHILSEVEATCERVLVIMKGELGADAKLADLRESNAAIVAIETGATEVAERLGKVEGVTKVEEVSKDETFTRWRVTSSATTELCPALFEALRGTTWKVNELRPEPKTLERVFSDLANKGVVS
jgi:ABC-2 type transport system ATP-binding protein